MLERHIARIKFKGGVPLEVFLQDEDRQESILYNLQMAIQCCIDIAAHIVSDESYGVADSTSELFYLLEEHRIIESDLTEKMIRAVGFRNLIVHEYGKIDLAMVYRVSHENLSDIETFLNHISMRFA